MVTAKPSSTWMGIMRKRGSPDSKAGIDEWGGIVHRLIKMAWSASHRWRPRVARVKDSSLYHSWEDCLRPYKATRRQDSRRVRFREARDLLHKNIQREMGVKKGSFYVEAHNLEVEMICEGQEDADAAQLHDRGISFPKVLGSLAGAPEQPSEPFPYLG